MPIASPPYTALLSGDYWTGIERTNTPVFVTYSFPISAPASHAGIAGLATGTFQAFSASQQTAARSALQQWADASGMTILEVPPGQGQINFALYDMGAGGGLGTGGFAFNPFGAWNYTTFTNFPSQAAFFSESGDGSTDGAGDVFINSANLAGGVIPANLLLHEIGHALGLKHPGDDQPDNITFSGTTTHDQTLEPSLNNTTQTVMSYNGAPPVALGALDVEAIQHIYGTNAQDGSQVSSWFWDFDTVTLTQLGFNAVDDIMLGTSVRDVMNGQSGNDRLFGYGGNDTLNGGSGADELWGGFGNDTVDAGVDGDTDTIFVTFLDGTAAQTDVIQNFNVADDLVDLQMFGPASFLGPASWEVIARYVLRTDAPDHIAPGNAQIYATWNGQLQTATLQGVAADLTSGMLVTALTTDNFVTASFFARDMTGTANADSIFGSLFGDTLRGGGGADLLAGDAGDDVFRFAAGDLVAGEIIDGGADTDRLELASGTHSLVGATLSSVEQIALSDTGATTVTLGSAAQASLFTTSASSDDTVIFNGDFTPAQLDALRLADIEHVQLVSNGNAVTANFTDRVLREIILQDTNANDVWETVVHTRDAAGVLTSLHTVFDYGIDEVISFVGGLTTTVVKTDLPGSPAYTWLTQLFTYDAAGTFLASMLQTEDNGDLRDHTYTGGALTRYAFTDVSDSNASIDFFAIDYSTGGLKTGSQTVFDNGVVAATTYTGGVRSSYLQTDAGNIDSSYATFLQHFAANGVTVTDQIYTHDNGSTTARNFVAGGTMTGTAANNTMTGAVGADTFIFAPAGSGGGGNDYIANFENGVDHIDLDAYGFTDFSQVQALAVANGPDGVYLTFSATNHLAVNGLSLANMTTDDFLL